MSKEVKKSCCSGKKQLSGAESAGIVLGSTGGAAGLAIGAYFLYKHLEKNGKLPWKVRAMRRSTSIRSAWPLISPTHTEGELRSHLSSYWHILRPGEGNSPLSCR